MASAPAPHLEEISPGIFAYVQPDGSWCLNNAAFVAGRRSVTVVDACATEQRTRALLGAIARTTAQRPDTLINTHAHLDHTFGNFVFGPKVTIVGHTRCREDVLAGAAAGIVERASRMFPGVDWGAVEIVAPALTFDDRLTLYVEDLRLELLALTPAHTTNDVAVWIPERRVLLAGDLLFHEGTPLAVAGSIAGWLEALETIRALGAEMLVPGHGPLGGPAMIDEVADYLRFVQATARQGVAAGVEPLALARETDLGRFAAWHDAERLVANLHRAYAERRGWLAYLRVNPLVDPLRGQPRFEALLEKLRL